MCDAFIPDASGPMRKAMGLRRGAGEPAFAGERVEVGGIAAVVGANAHGSAVLREAAFGLHLPGMERPLHNARVETAAAKKAFAQAFAQSRVAVPATLFEEKGHAFTDPDGGTILMAGISRVEKGRDGRTREVFAILTAPSCGGVAAVNDRMPLLLDAATAPAWIEAVPEEGAEARLQELVAEALRAHAAVGGALASARIRKPRTAAGATRKWRPRAATMEA